MAQKSGCVPTFNDPLRRKEHHRRQSSRENDILTRIQVRQRGCDLE